MDLYVFLAVLAAAACHAGWNALLKLNLEPLVATSLVAAASGIVAAPFALVVGMPSAAAWPYVLASVAIHIVYYLALAQAYRHRRPRPSLPDRARQRAADDGGARHALARRVARAVRVGRHRRARRRHPPAGGARRSILERLRWALGRLRAAHLADHHDLYAGGRHRRPPRRIGSPVYGVAVRAERRRHGRLRLGPHRQAARRRFRRQLEARALGRRAVDGSLRASPSGP